MLIGVVLNTLAIHEEKMQLVTSIAAFVILVLFDLLQVNLCYVNSKILSLQESGSAFS